MTEQEQGHELMFSENEEVNKYDKLLSWIENVILSQPQESLDKANDALTVAYTVRSTQFLKNYHKKKLNDVLFVSLQEPTEEVFQEFRKKNTAEETEKEADSDFDGRTFFEKLREEQEKQRLEILSQLKSLRRQNPDLQILFTDVKDGPLTMNLFKDNTSLESDFALVNPTVRLFRYGQVFNERTG